MFTCLSRACDCCRSCSDKCGCGSQLIGISGYFLLRLIGGRLSKNYISIGVAYGGSARGLANTYGGTSPFYLVKRHPVNPHRTADYFVVTLC